MYVNKMYCCGNKNKYTVISSTDTIRDFTKRERIIAVNLTCKRRLLSVYRIPKIERTKCLYQTMDE